MEVASAQESMPLPLEAVISTQKLDLRPARQPDFEAMNHALLTLAQTLANSPEKILQQLVETALKLCRAQSAGLSLLEEENNRKIFRWHGVAGEYAPHIWGTTPREFSPCGTVLDTDRVQLMSHLDRHFTYFAEVEPRIAEALLVPFHVDGKAVGTIWVISHDDQARQFDAEDARVLTTLSEFSAAAWQVVSEALALKSVFATVRDPLLILDSELQVQGASRSFYQTFQLAEDGTEGRVLHQLGNGEWDIPELRTLLESIIQGESAVGRLEVRRTFGSLGPRVLSLDARTLMFIPARRAEKNEKIPTTRVLLAIEDITDRKPTTEEESIRVERIEQSIPQATQELGGLIGNSAALKKVIKHVEVVAPTDATVLILGETGTGKELVARSLHKLSLRSNRPFISINCAAIPTGLLESELFGYERGAFTGALTQKIGRFEMANHGTLFLDEVGDIPPDLQPKLLRALQEHAFERLGGTRTIPIDVRLVAATNRDLLQMMREKLFRADLYYRLMVFPIVTSPLRDHPEDIPALAHHFTRKYAAKMDRQIEAIPSETMDALIAWPWPGNVRELENFIERSVILTSGSVLRAPVAELQADAEGASGHRAIDDVERASILRVYRETGGVVSATAARLGIPRTTLHSRMKKLGISPDDL